jgi:hypothetical protein
MILGKAIRRSGFPRIVKVIHGHNFEPKRFRWGSASLWTLLGGLLLGRRLGQRLRWGACFFLEGHWGRPGRCNELGVSQRMIEPVLVELSVGGGPQ